MLLEHFLNLCETWTTWLTGGSTNGLTALRKWFENCLSVCWQGNKHTHTHINTQRHTYCLTCCCADNSQLCCQVFGAILKWLNAKVFANGDLFLYLALEKNAYNAFAWHRILLQIPTFWHLSGLNKTFKGQVFEVSKGSMNFKPAKEIKRRYFLKNELEKYIFISLHFQSKPSHQKV